MTTRVPLLIIIGGLVFLLLAGCHIGRCQEGYWQMCPTIWTKEVTEELRVDTAGLTRLEARTRNGAVSYVGHADHEPAMVVIVTKKGGGLTLKDAEDALDAIDVYVEPRGFSAKRIAWRWKTLKKNTWSACVSYKIDGPAELAFDAETHNGAIDASGIVADVKVVTHNGHIKVESAGGGLRVETHNGQIVANYDGKDAALTTHNGPIEVKASGGRLRATTHNGRITANYDGNDITLETHNNRVEADLTRCKSLGGKISSHNGSITLTVSDELSADLTCATHNGSIRCDVPWEVHTASRYKLTGRIGQGGPKLTTTTYNGDIRIKSAGN